MDKAPPTLRRHLDEVPEEKAMARQTRATVARSFENNLDEARRILGLSTETPSTKPDPEAPIDDYRILRFITSRDEDLGTVLAVNEAEWQRYLYMIPSENIASPAVRAILSCRLTDVYAEGYDITGRYYTGTGPAALVEELAIERCRELFGAKHAVVQALSGAPANVAVYMALLRSGILQWQTAPDGTRTPSPNYEANPADRVLAMNLADGGHLTHGLSLNFSGRFYDFRHYGVNEQGFVDYEQIEEMARTLKPRMIVIGASAYPREYDYGRIRKICDEAESKPTFMVDMSHYVGLVAAGLLSNPLDRGADVVTSTTHKTLGGPRGAFILTNDDEIYAKVKTALFPGLQGGAHFNNIASIAYVLGWAKTEQFREFQKGIQENARVLAAELGKLGVTPLSGGTDTHLILVDLRPLGFVGKKGKPLTGRQASEALEQSGLIINRNAVPLDDKKPWITSGIRMGTSVLTARGMGPEEMKTIAGLIHRVLESYGDKKVYDEVLEAVFRLTGAFPIRSAEG